MWVPHYIERGGLLYPRFKCKYYITKTLRFIKYIFNYQYVDTLKLYLFTINSEWSQITVLCKNNGTHIAQVHFKKLTKNSMKIQ